MKTIGIFEAKTKLSEICEEVARTHVPVTITRRGVALVYIEPAIEQRMSIKERRAAYMRNHGAREGSDAADFMPSTRSREQSTFKLKD